MWNLTTYDCGCNKACKIDKYLDTRNCICEILLIGKLVLAGGNNILNTTEISLDEVLQKGEMRKK